MAQREEFEWEIVYLDFAKRDIGRSGSFIGSRARAKSALRQAIRLGLQNDPYFWGAYAHKIQVWVRGKSRPRGGN